MSFTRLIYWSGLLGGWSAFIAWLFCEVVFGRWANVGGVGLVLAILMSTLVAAAIGGGLSQAAGLVNFRMQEQILRLGLGLIGGFIGGLIGSLPGNLLAYLVGDVMIVGPLVRILGWMIMGAAVGVVEGVYDRSFKKIRNGLIGGTLGGFLGGLFFVVLASLSSALNMQLTFAMRAIGFVLIGLFVGFLVGLAQVLLKEAWLTVEAGFRPGRQLILSQEETTMGTSEKAGLIFIAFGAKGVEPVHVKIIRESDGSFLLVDNNSRSGTLLNGEKLEESVALRDGDTIQFGVNVVRFNERFKRAGEDEKSPAKRRKKPAAAVTLPEVKEPQPVLLQAATPAPVQVLQPARPAPAAPPVVAIKPAAPPPAPRPAPSPPPQRPATPFCPVCGSMAIVTNGGEKRCSGCGTVLF